MQTRALPLALALLMSGLPALAQETAEAPATEAPAAEAPAADAASDLNMGTEESTTPQPGDPYIREEFGDWALRCIYVEDGDDPCQLYQLLRNEEGTAVAEMSIFPLSNGGRAAAGATIVVPLETLLTENLRLSVDGGKARVYPYSFCNRAGCVARVGFTEEDVSAFKRGAKAVLRMVPAAAPDQVVALDVSLNGFTAGISSIDPQ